MQTPKARSVSSEVPQKVSPRAARQLRPAALETESASASTSTQTSRTPKDKSPKVVERRSPRSPVSQKKRPSKISELESQVLQLQEELKKAKDQLSLFESWKNQASQNAEEGKKQWLAASSKLERSKPQLLELSGSEQESGVDLQWISQEPDPTKYSEHEGVQKHNAIDSVAMNEIQQLKVEPEVIEEASKQNIWVGVKGT